MFKLHKKFYQLSESEILSIDTKNILNSIIKLRKKKYFDIKVIRKNHNFIMINLIGENKKAMSLKFFKGTLIETSFIV